MCPASRSSLLVGITATLPLHPKSEPQCSREFLVSTYSLQKLDSDIEQTCGPQSCQSYAHLSLGLRETTKLNNGQDVSHRAQILGSLSSAAHDDAVAACQAAQCCTAQAVRLMRSLGGVWVVCSLIWRYAQRRCSASVGHAYFACQRDAVSAQKQFWLQANASISRALTCRLLAEGGPGAGLQQLAVAQLEHDAALDGSLHQGTPQREGQPLGQVQCDEVHRQVLTGLRAVNSVSADRQGLQRPACSIEWAQAAWQVIESHASADALCSGQSAQCVL